MDSGFDDLLSSSRINPILDNPFEDPFARPSFPDPWLTYSHEPEATDTINNSFGNNEPPPQSPSVSEQEPDQQLSESQESPTSTTRIPDTDGPLDIKTANQEEQEDLLNLPTQHNTPSSDHPSPIISPIAPTPKSISETSSALSDSEPPPQNSESPLTKSYDTLTGSTPAPEQLPPPPKPELPSQTSTLVQSSESSLSTFISPLDNSYNNGYSSYSSFAATANDNAGWSSTPNLRYSTEERWNNSAGWGSHTINGTVDVFGNGASTRPNDDDDDDDVPIAVGLFHLLSYSSSYILSSSIRSKRWWLRLQLQLVQRRRPKAKKTKTFRETLRCLLLLLVIHKRLETQSGLI